jgi:putative ABC transport system permease protein
MFIHYLKIAWRNLLKHKTQSVISVLGLAIGVVFFAYGYHWYKYETTYDSFYPDSDRIYLLYGLQKSTQKPFEEGYIPYIAVEKLRNTFPEIEEVSIVFSNYGSALKHKNQNLGYPSLEFVNENFFKFFPQKVIAGKITDEWSTNNEIIVVTENFALKHFGSIDSALNQTLVSGYEEHFNIRAVIENPPKNTIFQREGYVRDHFVREFSTTTDETIQWRDFKDAKPFLLLHENIDIKSFREKIKTFAIDNDYNNDLLLEITPLSSVKYYFPVNNFNSTFDISYIRIFIFVGILLLLAAFFNYLNILVSTTYIRAQEMNLRRVSGASTGSIFHQLIVEILIVILVVTFLSFLTVELTTNGFERTFSTIIIQNKVYNILLASISIAALLLIVSTYILLYRFIRKTSFRKQVSGKKKFVFNHTSLVLQLIISFFFIMSAFILNQQIKFMNQIDWGFRKDNLLQLDMKLMNREELVNSVKQLPMIEGIIETDYFKILPNTDQMGSLGITDVEWENKSKGSNPVFQIIGVSNNFIDEIEITVIEGRNFTEEDYVSRAGTQTNKIIINETAKKVLGLYEAIGKEIIIPTNSYSPQYGRGKEKFEIAGVIKDFHTVGLQSATPPLFIKGVKLKSQGSVNYLRITEGMENEAINEINKLIPEYIPDNKNELLVRSVNSILNDLSKTEKGTFKLFITVAILCVLIAIFGIYSVSQRDTQKRRKEIAIRKTAGAKSKEIIKMFLRDYLTLTLISAVISLPLSWLFMEQWLQNFAYRISISWWMFAVVFLIVATIVILTIITQVIRAANQNPAKEVKSE